MLMEDSLLQRKHLPRYELFSLYLCNDTYMVIITIAWYFPYNNIFWKFTLRDVFGHLSNGWKIIRKCLRDALVWIVNIFWLYKEIKIFGWLNGRGFWNKVYDRFLLVHFIFYSFLLSRKTISYLWFSISRSLYDWYIILCS